MPSGDGRDEVHRPLGAALRAPAALARAVAGWTRGRPLSPVAVVRTQRTTRVLRDDAGRVLARWPTTRCWAPVGSARGRRRASGWREVEVEPVDAGPELLEAADELFAAAGSEPRVQALAKNREEGRDTALHEVRKGAKRLRYACETLEPWWAEAKPLRKAAQHLAQVLGEREDTVVSRDDLRRIAREAAAAGEDGFTYGRLHAREQARAAELEKDFGQAWRRARRTKLRAWTQDR